MAGCGVARAHTSWCMAASCTAGSDGGAAAAPKAPQCGARHDREHASPSGGRPPWFAHPPGQPLGRAHRLSHLRHSQGASARGLLRCRVGSCRWASSSASWVPQGWGKTQVGIALAARLGVRVISCDSLQIYHGMPVLTNQPSPTEINAVPHEMIGVADPRRSGGGATRRRCAPIEADLARVGGTPCWWEAPGCT